MARDIACVQLGRRRRSVIGQRTCGQEPDVDANHRFPTLGYSACVVDKASPNLHLACCTGKHYDQALLTIRKAGDKPVEYYKLTLEEVLVSSVSMGGQGSDDRLTENVTLNFAKFKSEYTPQKPDGSGDAAVEGTFHIAKNLKM